MYLNSPVFNNVSRLNYSSRINNTLQAKIKSFSHNFLKLQKHPRDENDTTFFSWSTIIEVKRHAHICKGLLQPTCLVTVNIWLNFLLIVFKIFGFKPSLHVPFEPLYPSQKTFQIQNWELIFFCHIKLT